MSDFIPQELILQILYHLPVQALVKCTLVCKSWQSLITSSDFINTHLAKTLSKPINSQPLLTRHFTESPNEEHYFLRLNRESLDIYQTLKSPLKPRTDEAYRRIVVAEKGWRMISGEGLECSFHETRWRQFFVNGRVYWIVYEKKMLSNAKNLVLSFDLDDEKFKKLKLPESLLDVHPMKLFISVTKGMLTVSEYYSGEAKNSCVNIWVRTEYGDVKSWSKLYSVDVLRGVRRIFGFTGKDEVYLAKYEGGMWDSYADLLLYDPKTRQTKVVQPHGNNVEAIFIADYTESLVLLNKESGTTSYEEAEIEEKQEYVNPESGEGTSNLGLEEDRSVISQNDADEEEEDGN
ncbi:hypothetical protein PTKIN_Ptkin05aG0022000 [Pterospermum kingtungense]